jgi:hypothetical protein
LSIGTTAATAVCGTSQSARPSGVAHRSSHASTAVAAICASSTVVDGHHRREAPTHEAEMVCRAANAILINAVAAVSGCTMGI